MTPPAVGVVLAGGASARMGTAKAAIPWEGGTLLTRAVAALRPAVGRVVVVRAPGQDLPALADDIAVVQDARPGRGPLEGMLAGLRALRPDEVAFVCAVDMPLLEAPFAAAVLAGLRPVADAAVPRLAGAPHPLAAAYRADVAGPVAALLATDRLRVGGLLDEISVTWLDAPALPGGAGSLMNVNTAADLAAARQLRREKATGSPAATPPGGTSASASAPASDVMAWAP